MRLPAGFIPNRTATLCASRFFLLLPLFAFSVNAVEVKPWNGGATPPLELKDLSGSVRTLADWRGKVLVVNFWATWCEPCIEEMPSLQKLGQRHAARGLAFPRLHRRSAGVAGTSDLTDAAPIFEGGLRFLEIEIPLVVHQLLRLLLPDAHHLRRLFFQGHGANHLIQRGLSKLRHTRSAS